MVVHVFNSSAQGQRPAWPTRATQHNETLQWKIKTHTHFKCNSILHVLHKEIFTLSMLISSKYRERCQAVFEGSLFGDRVSLCDAGWPWTQITVSVSQVLWSQVCDTSHTSHIQNQAILNGSSLTVRGAWCHTSVAPAHGKLQPRMLHSRLAILQKDCFKSKQGGGHRICQRI